MQFVRMRASCMALIAPWPDVGSIYIEVCESACVVRG